jgi:acyl-CoA thioesterase-1
MSNKRLISLKRRHFILHSASGAAVWALPAAGTSAQPAQQSGSGSHPMHKIVVLGDSLSAEYGLARGTGWVALLGQRLQQSHPEWRVVNASISGDTSSGGRSRLPGLLRQHQPALLVIELGANDALRGLPLDMTASNLNAMIQAGLQAQAKVLLIGTQVPPNYGQRYTRDFAALFEQLAQHNKIGLVPFMLAGVADTPDAARNFQDDRIHPLAVAHPTILDNIWPQLRLLMPS